MTEITVDFDEPFYGGSADATALANLGGSLVAVDGVIYPIDTASNRYVQKAVEILQQRNTTDNRDILLLPQNVWRQQVSNWQSGAGQSNMDRDDAIQSRYEDSFGVDPWRRWRLELLPETLSLRATTNPTFLTLHTGHVVVVEGNTTYWYTDFDTLEDTITFGPDTIIDIADRGATVLGLNDQGYIYEIADHSSTAAQYYNQALTGANMIAWEKDYLLCGHQNVLKWVKTGNNIEVVYTHPDTAFRWESACSGPQAIYFLGGVGDQHVVHKVTIKDDGTGLNPAIVAVQLPDGEVGYKIESYLGYVFIGTNKGVRMAQPDANGDLTLGALIPTDEPVRAFEGQDRFMWYGLSSMTCGYTPVNSDEVTEFPTSPVPGIGRMDLSTFTTSALTPAYANDLAVWDEAAAPVKSIITFNGKRVFSVDGVGVFYEGTNHVPAGYMQQGVMSFSVEDLKTALYMQAKWEPDCQGRLLIDLGYDSASFARYAKINTSPTSIRSDNINLYGTQFSRVNLRLVLVRCPIDNTKGPIPTRWELRAVPVVGKASRWDVPLIVADDVDINGIVRARKPIDTKNALVDLITSGRVFQYQESGQSYQVIARDFLWQPERLSTTGNGWQGTFLITLEEVM